VVVFLLVTEHGFKKEYRFKIPNYLFNAPTVVSEIEYQIKKYSGITASIQRIKEQLIMRKSWTEQEVEIIKTMYPDNLTENLLPFLVRSISKIMGKANLMMSALF
jgi:hypothetical protein